MRRVIDTVGKSHISSEIGEPMRAQRAGWDSLIFKANHKL